MGWLWLVLDVVFALGGVAAFGILAFGAWLVFKHSTAGAWREPRVIVDKGKLV